MIRYAAANAISEHVEEILEDVVPTMQGIPEISAYLRDSLLLSRRFGKVSTLTCVHVAYPPSKDGRALALLHADVEMAQHSNEQCAICLHALRRKHRVFRLSECHHGFHNKCISAWFERDISCPVCRSRPAPIID